MKVLVIAIVFALFAPSLLMAQASKQNSGQSAPVPASNNQTQENIETEKVKIPDSLQTPPVIFASQPGYMTPAQSREMLNKLWQAESRVKDLLTQVHLERWKISDASRAAVQRDLDMLSRNLAALEESRQQFAGRVDSEYLGFETYASISQVLPPLSTLAQAASRYQDFALAGEFNQAWNDMLTMQQALKPYLSFLLRNHDQTFLIMESNLASCQNQFASRRESEEHAVPMKNIPPVFKGRRRTQKKPGQEKPNANTSTSPNATTKPQEKKP